MIEPKFVRVQQACKLLLCSRPTLYKHLRSGEIKSFREGNVRLIDLASIFEYIARGIENDPWVRAGVSRGVGQPAD